MEQGFRALQNPRGHLRQIQDDLKRRMIMTTRPDISPDHVGKVKLENLRSRVFEEKAVYRSHLAKAPISEKLRVLEEMRAFTAATRQARAENKELAAAAWVNSTPQ
jgi:hypothetical protein